MTIDPKPDQAQVIDAAIRAGLIKSPDDALDIGVNTLRGRLRSSRTVPADEWMRKFRDWANSHPTDTPLLSDEAVSRESIYSDRGL